MRGIIGMGLSAFIGAVLVGVGTFTKGWYSISFPDPPSGNWYKSWYGIVPYHSQFPDWLKSTAWCMYSGFAFSLVLVLQSIALGHQFRYHGCCSRLMRQSLLAGIFAATTAGVVIAGFATFTSNYEAFGWGPISVSMGYSPYLCLSGGTLIFLTAVYAFYFARHVHYH